MALETNEEQVYCTTDYALFSHMKGNRPIDQKNVDKLAENMKKVGFKKAFRIVVDPEGRVKIGQHRLLAAEQAQVPVYYVVDTELTVQEMQDAENMQKKWSLHDYIYSYAQLGNEEYIKLESTYVGSVFPQAAISQFWGRAYGISLLSYYEHVKKGIFKFTDQRKAKFDLLQRQVLDIFEFNKKLINRANAVEGTLVLICHPDYNHRQMLHKLENMQSRLVVCPTRDEYTKILFEIYNYKNHGKHLIAPQRRITGRG